MLKALLSGLLRSNLLIDLALDTQRQLVDEIRAGALSLALAGFGFGLLLASLVALSVAGLEVLDGIGVGSGLVLAIGGGWRARVAHQRLIRLKNLLSAKAAREAALRAASASAALVVNGVSGAGSVVRRLFTRKKKLASVPALTAEDALKKFLEFPSGESTKHSTKKR